jgi:hypothetical protein
LSRFFTAYLFQTDALDRSRARLVAKTIFRVVFYANFAPFPLKKHFCVAFGEIQRLCGFDGALARLSTFQGRKNPDRIKVPPNALRPKSGYFQYILV